jgi:ribonuclease HI
LEADYAIFFDGGHSVGHQLAVGAVVCSPAGEVIVEQATRAGEGTANLAEYRALSFAICMANLVGARRPVFLSDSLLVVQQVNGFWAMRGDPGSPLSRAHSQCTCALMRFDRWTLRHVPRERNRRADWLVCRLLEHKRTLKKPPPVVMVEHDGNDRPGWSSLPPSRPHATAKATVASET